MSIELSGEEKELARLIVERTSVVEDNEQINRKHDFEKIQEKASASLKSMIEKNSRAASFQDSPIGALIPESRRRVFDCFVKELSGGDAAAGAQKSASSPCQEGEFQEDTSIPTDNLETSLSASTHKLESGEAIKEKRCRAPSLSSTIPLNNRGSFEEEDGKNPKEEEPIEKISLVPGDCSGSLLPVASTKTPIASAVGGAAPSKSTEGETTMTNRVSQRNNFSTEGTGGQSPSEAHQKKVYIKHPNFKHEFDAVPRTLASSLMLKELAMIIELNATDGTIRWSRILQKASVPLRSYIESRQREGASYGMSPLKLIVPIGQRDTFRKLRLAFRKRRPLAASIDKSWKRRKLGCFHLTVAKIPKRGGDRGRKVLAFKPRCNGEEFEFDENEKKMRGLSEEARGCSSRLEQPSAFEGDDSDDDDDDFDVLKAVKRSVLADLKKQKFSRRKASLKSLASKPTAPPTPLSRALTQTRSNPDGKIAPKIPKPGARQSSKNARLSHELSFAERVYNLVNESSKLAPEVLCWEHNGRAFRVKDTGTKLGKLLERHFRHNKYSSFQRQLNMYGFTKHVSGKYLGCFQHEHFRIGGKESLFLIRRRGPPNRRHSFSYLGDEKKAPGAKSSHVSTNLHHERKKSGSKGSPTGIEERADVDEDQNGKGHL